MSQYAEYERGQAGNIVQFSPYEDVAFNDTGVQINDDANPSKSVLWSSEKIVKTLNEANRSQQHQQIQQHPHQQMPRQGGAGVAANLGPFNANANANFSIPRYEMGNRPYVDKNEYYPNGYKVYYRHKYGHKFWRALRPGWWLSFIIPSREHYCDKCCNYLEHTWSTIWKDNPNLSSNSCNCQSKCNKTNHVPMKRSCQTMH